MLKHPSVKMTTGTLATFKLMKTTDYGLDYIQLPKFNTCIAVGDRVILNEVPGTVIFIKDTELTLAHDGRRWTIYLTDIQTFKRS